MKRKVKDVVAEVTKKVVARSPKSPKIATAAASVAEATDEDGKKEKVIKTAKPEPPAFIARTHTSPQMYSLRPEENLCNIVTWNVAGLRGALKNNKDVFDQLVQVRGRHSCVCSFHKFIELI